MFCALRKIENIVLTWIENVDEHKEQGDQHGHSTRHDFWWNQKTDPWYHHEQTCKETMENKLQKNTRLGQGTTYVSS